MQQIVNQSTLFKQYTRISLFKITSVFIVTKFTLTSLLMNNYDISKKLTDQMDQRVRNVYMLIILQQIDSPGAPI